ncbi:MAG TPA: M20/M25/M40 family metallo-hydrolase [Anaerolineales bacterium]|nr:M20/M25/M40 family metallo-hydrolase [Anaerolineales bacterium]
MSLLIPDLPERVLQEAITIQQIPAPTHAETARSRYVFQRFVEEGLADVQMDSPGNVYGCLPGSGTGLPVVISAHLDTVFPADTDLTLRPEQDRLYGPGIGDNSVGVAGLFGIVWELRARHGDPGGPATRLPGDVWLVANVCEEGLGNLTGMRAVVERFGAEVAAYLVLEGMSLGQIYHRGLGVKRYRIRVQTAGGHSWVDYGQPSAVNELAQLICELTRLPLPARPRTTLNVGVITGGTTVNTIAARAEMELDLRSEDPQVLQELASQVETLIQRANRPDVKVTGEVIGDRPVGKISARHPLVQLAKTCLSELGIEANLGIGSTDTNIPLSMGYPAICLGLTHGGSAHTTGEYIFKPPLKTGLRLMVSVIESVFAELS